MSPRRAPQQASLFELELDGAPADLEPGLEPVAAPTARRLTPARRPARAPFRARLFAGLVDAAMHVLIAALAIAGARLLGVSPAAAQAPAFALLLLVFSLFYTVVPLAFWGRTPGLLAAGLACRAAGEHPLTFDEALRRWLGELVTALLLGLPGLLAIGAARRSLADRLSASELVAG